MAHIEEPANLLAWNEATGLIPPRKALAAGAHVQQPFIKAFHAALEKYSRGYHEYQTAILNRTSRPTRCGAQDPPAGAGRRRP